MHVHIDLEDSEKDRMRQFNLATAIDPSFAFMSCSPYYKGDNTIKDMRVMKYRHEVHKRFPNFCKLVPYQETMGQLYDYFKDIG